MEHLHPKLKDVINLSDEERIYHIQNEKWIGYSRAEQAFLELETLLKYPPSSRMPGLLIAGETNNGKTALLNKFLKMNPVKMEEGKDGVSIPVVKIQAPPFPDESRLYNEIMTALNLPFRVNDKVEHKHRQVVHVMKECKVKLLIIDEIHSMLSGPALKQRVFLNIIKYLTNDLGISMVVAGTKDAKAALGIDPQLVNRFEPFELQRWKMDNEFSKLLASFERIIPLKEPSKLYENEIASRIYSLCDGKLGEISTIVKRSAELAIKDKSERIQLKHLGKIRYTVPESRRQ